MTVGSIDSPRVAYFSMEIGLDSSMPTYSGGLGVLAGDVLQAAADMSFPMVGMTLLHRKGYFSQLLDERGNQYEKPASWDMEEHLEALPRRVVVMIEGRPVRIRAWRYVISGVSGYQVPVYFLDTDMPENIEGDRHLTDRLYGGDSLHRLRQEALLGLGGIAMLRALGYSQIQTYHMNEGHCAFLTLALLREVADGSGPSGVTPEMVEAVRRHCVFTTHTPVSAGHDEFPIDMARQVLGDENMAFLSSTGASPNGTLNMSRLALEMSVYVNGVSKRHGEVSRGMFPDHSIASITNGVHAGTWTSPAFTRLYDRHVPDWRQDNNYLRSVIDISLEEIQAAHAESKAALIDKIEKDTGIRLGQDVMTLGFARRVAPYKRAAMLFSDLSRLRMIADRVGPMQIVYAGKAHPQDEWGKSLIRKIFEAAEALRGTLPVIYLEDYDMALGRLLCSGVDLWLNTPQRLMEASGTSGMKAALNGVPTLSVLDGWWVEGHVEGATGWSIGEPGEEGLDQAKEVESLYSKLENIILPMFYHDPAAYAHVMRSAIALNGSFFNAQRMLNQYVENAYLSAGNGIYAEGIVLPSRV